MANQPARIAPNQHGKTPRLLSSQRNVSSSVSALGHNPRRKGYRPKPSSANTAVHVSLSSVLSAILKEPGKPQQSAARVTNKASHPSKHAQSTTRKTRRHSSKGAKPSQSAIPSQKPRRTQPLAQLPGSPSRAPQHPVQPAPAPPPSSMNAL